jgi:hypothetical protein
MVKLDLIPPAPAHIYKSTLFTMPSGWAIKQQCYYVNGAFHHRSTLGYIILHILTTESVPKKMAHWEEESTSLLVSDTLISRLGKKMLICAQANVEG